MKNLVKKLLVAVFAISTLFTANSFADDIELWKKSTLNEILQRGELRVGMEPGYMPFEMKDKKGRIIGYDVDMAKKMAKEMGVKLKLVPTSWDGIIAGLLTNKYDLHNLIWKLYIDIKEQLQSMFQRERKYLLLSLFLLLLNQ